MLRLSDAWLGGNSLNVPRKFATTCCAGTNVHNLSAIQRRYMRDSKALFEKLKTIATLQPQPEVHIRADQEVRYESVGRVVATCQRASILKIGFITEPPPRQ